MTDGHAEHEQPLRLPPWLTLGLTSALCHALDHPVRRRVLRTLNRDGKARTIDDLAAANPGCNLARLNYHMALLADMDIVSTVRAQLTHPRTAQRLLKSKIADDLVVRLVLQATEADDVRE